MRKDVKLGFAVGGVLLAVLIVYVLVVPGGKDQRLTSAAGGGDGVTLEPVDPAPAQAGGEGATAQVPPPAPPATFDPPAGGVDPFAQPRPSEELAQSDSGTSDDVDWSKLLNDSQMLMVTPAKPQTTVAIASPAESASTERETDAGEALASAAGAADDAASSIPDITKPGPTPIVVPPPAPGAEAAPAPAQEHDAAAPVTAEAPPPAETVAPSPAEPKSEPADAAASNGAQQIHVVEPGETFTTISLRYYSNPNLYPAIMRANPGIDPQRLRPGMKVVVPPQPAPAPAVSVDGARAQVSATRIESPIDATTQYRVQPGDSLYSIAKKLYGRGDRSTRLYEANKAAIGADMNAIKVGQVLTLPEPPTQQ